MSAHAAPAPSGPTFTIRGRPYPVLLPKLADPRLHLAAVIISLQVIGQVGFHFDLSIAQILLAIGTAAVLEVAIAMRSQHVLMWPASATLTGNGVAFVLRVPGTVHGDWWSLRGWWIYVGTAAVSLLSKHVIRWRGEHIFNPSNIGLVLCFMTYFLLQGLVTFSRELAYALLGPSDLVEGNAEASMAHLDSEDSKLVAQRDAGFNRL
jgi:hypothetical protein